jgi:hypothetical protein
MYIEPEAELTEHLVKLEFAKVIPATPEPEAER